MSRHHVYVGTSGWIYDDWSGRFYPEDVKGTNRLLYYVNQFNTVEVNATFYRTPSDKIIDGWNQRLPRGFHLVVKGSRIITHFNKLHNCDESLKKFLEAVLKLKTLRIILWQLPPSFKKNPQVLDGFLSLLPGQVRHAVEFRHKSWWDEDITAVLSRHKAAFVAVSHPELPSDIFSTADFLYVRFHGAGKRLYQYNYSQEELAEWVSRIKMHMRGREVYAFFNNDYRAYAPKNALVLGTLLKDN